MICTDIENRHGQTRICKFLSRDASRIEKTASGAEPESTAAYLSCEAWGNALRALCFVSRVLILEQAGSLFDEAKTTGHG